MRSDGRAPGRGVKTHRHTHNPKHRYELLETLGKGAYGTVKRAVERQSGRTVAIKSIRKERLVDDLDRAHIKREIEITSSLTHSNIIQIYEVFESREKILLVMEYVSGGELYEYLQQRQRLSEDEARHFFRQITSAVHYCHKNGVVHRDLKLENILLDQELNVKLADFGLSNRYQRDRCLETFCGSPLYASPEIINGLPYQGPEVDCWALGVLLYALVHGSMPFDGDNYITLKEQISQGSYRKPDTYSDANALIDWMLTVNVEERATVEDVANHWWLNLSCMTTVSDREHNGYNHSHLTNAKIYPSSSTKTLGGQTQGSTLPQKTERSSTHEHQQGSSICCPTPLPSCHPASCSHNQPPKLPKKGILKKLYEQVEYQGRQEGGLGNGQDAGDNKGTLDGRKRKGILKRNSEFPGLDLTSNGDRDHKPALTALPGGIQQYEEEGLEIAITVWKT